MQILITILIILLIYYGVKILARLFGPMLLKYASKKMETKVRQKFEQYQQYQQQSASGAQQGETVIDHAPQNDSRKNSSGKVGEYIEFEEID
ncbi:DUF4834 domain-containing protein [Robertkochia solimangrovi]|nr:DUF4834 family protein [Robertkochia solimangrovi]TRZ45446.1 DUF4834 domain-containing protein [Robertkochia solimangrovi]